MFGNRLASATLLLLVITALGCRDAGVGPIPADPLLDRYVALGNSITAGFESEGINDSTQTHAYAVQFAERFNAPYGYARVRRPGCPAPLVGPVPLTAERVGGARPGDCAGLRTTLPARNQSLAVPGIRIADALRGPLETTFAPFNVFIRLLFREIFGGRTLVEAMINANPTLVSVWLGNNDVLTAVTSGDVAHLTATDDFVESLEAITDAIATRTTAEDVILLGVSDPLLIPLVQPGLYYWLLAQAPATHSMIGNRPVSDDCGPGSPGSANLVSFRIARSSESGISCADDAPFVLATTERETIRDRIDAFNEAIRSQALAHGWIYIDVPSIQAEHVADPQRNRLCQGLLEVDTEEEMREMMQATCPLPREDPRDFFGTFFSFDGFHPSREGQRVIADRMEAAVRAKHGI